MFSPFPTPVVTAHDQQMALTKADSPSTASSVLGKKGGEEVLRSIDELKTVSQRLPDKGYRLDLVKMEAENIVEDVAPTSVSVI